MAERSAPFAGILLVSLGLALLLGWVAFAFLWPAPLEEPANLMKIPNPSQAPWFYDPASPPRKDRLVHVALTYGWPGLGMALLLVGGFLATARRGR